jgi:hypothetical protein
MSTKGTTSPISDSAVMLWLPSSIPTSLRSSSCVDGLAAKEIVLRIADCSDSLHNLWRCLREFAIISNERSKHLNGQCAQTRALSIRKALRDKCDRLADRYRRSYVAWLALDPEQMFEGGEWKDVLLELKQADMVFPGHCLEAGSDDEAANSTDRTKHSSKKRQGEGKIHVTWI